MEEKGSRHFRGPGGNRTNSSARAEGISKASAGQMQLRERAKRKVNKAAGPDRPDGKPPNGSQRDRRTTAVGGDGASFSFPREKRKHSLCGGGRKEPQKAIRLFKEARKKLERPGSGVCTVTREGRGQRAGFAPHTPSAEPTSGKLRPPQQLPLQPSLVLGQRTSHLSLLPRFLPSLSHLPPWLGAHQPS